MRFCCDPAPSLCDNWTPWLDRDNVSGYGDYETVADFIKEGKLKDCEKPTMIEGRVISTGVPA